MADLLSDRQRRAAGRVPLSEIAPVMGSVLTRPKDASNGLVGIDFHL
jgi:hypothetical protein